MAVTDFLHAADVHRRVRAGWLRPSSSRCAGDYLRNALPADRRDLLFNPTVKMKVTTQGEEVINLLWDVIAAKGFERDMVFEMAACDIPPCRSLKGRCMSTSR